MIRTSIITLDANLLVLFVVGAADREYIGKHKRLRAFSVEDFDLLVKMMADASNVVVTPNTLTETSNLIGQIGGPARDKIYLSLKILVKKCSEVYIASSSGSDREEFVRLGLTDAVLLELSDPDTTLITTDLDLYIAAAKLGKKVINFNHYRDAVLNF